MSFGMIPRSHMVIIRILQINFVLLSKKNLFSGVVHHDDLLYLFRVSLFPDFPTDSDALKIVERMTRIWANFAKSGQPISKEDENLFNNVTWEKFTLINPKYLEIDSNLSMKSNLNQKRMNLWDKLFVINS